MKQLSITILLLLGWLSAAAQHDLYNWQLKGYTGIANYYNTDKNTDDYFKTYDNLLYRFEIGKSLGNTFGLAAGASYGNVRGLGQAGEAFTTEARMASVRLYFYTDNGWLLNTSAFVSPFFFGGYGLSTLQTNYNGTSYETKQMQVVPFGMGLKFRLAERWQLDLHTEAVYNTKVHLTAVAPEQNDYNNTILHTGLSLAYSFGFKKSTFKAPVLYAGFLPPPASPRGPVRPARRSMLDYILELEPKEVQLENPSSGDNLVQGTRQVDSVAVRAAPVTSDRLAVYDTIPTRDIDSLQLMQDTTGLRSKEELTQLPDSVDVDSVRQTTDNQSTYRTEDDRAAAEEDLMMDADTIQFTPDTEMLSDTVTNTRLRQQQMRLRERERQVREREQDVRDREQEARERELDARERAINEAGGVIEEPVRSNTTSRLTPAEQRERARVQERIRVQEPARVTREPRTVYVPDTRTIRVDGGRAPQLDPNTVLLLEQDRRELDAINRNNRQLRNSIDSLQAATAADTSQDQQLQEAPANIVDDKLLIYMQRQASLNDSIMHRLGFYESELQRLRAAEAAPKAAPAAPEIASTTNVFFGLNSHTVPAASYDELLAVAALLKENPELSLRLTGYTDQTGDAKYNMVLSRKRAAAVADFIKAQGIAGERITTAHLGEVASGGNANPAFRKVALEITK